LSGFENVGNLSAATRVPEASSREAPMRAKIRRLLRMVRKMFRKRRRVLVPEAAHDPLELAFSSFKGPMP